MSTDTNQMEAFLNEMQYLQKEDGFSHNFTVKARKCDNKDIVLTAMFFSNVECDDDGDPFLYRCTLDSSLPLRKNIVEFTAFKTLLAGDVKKTINVKP